jgi:hypothetical protein
MEEHTIKDPKKVMELVYYHLIAMDYSNAIIDKTKEKVSIVLSPKNKNPEKYKVAYDLIKNALEKSQRCNNEHKEKAKQHICKSVLAENLAKIERKRKIENDSLVRAHLNEKEKDLEIEFKTANQL